MNEKLEKFRKNLKDMPEEEKIQQAQKCFDMLESIPKIDFEESMKALAKIRGKDENHYLGNKDLKEIVQVEIYMLRLVGTNKYYADIDLMSYDVIYKSIDKGARFRVIEDCEKIKDEWIDIEHLEIIKVKITYEVEE